MYQIKREQQHRPELGLSTQIAKRSEKSPITVRFRQSRQVSSPFNLGHDRHGFPDLRNFPHLDQSQWQKSAPHNKTQNCDRHKKRRPAKLTKIQLQCSYKVYIRCHPTEKPRNVRHNIRIKKYKLVMRRFRLF